MRITASSRCLILALAASQLLAPLAQAAVHVADTSASPHAQIRTVGLDEVRWTGGFWADRFELCRTQMVPAMWRLMEGTNRSQYLRNFQIAAGLVEGRSRGASFNDGDFYKWIEGACAVFAATRDPELERTIEDVISVIAKAQRGDGYLHTPVLIRQRNGDTNAVPFQDRNNFEVYNLGHLMTAACVHHRVTGRTNLLAVARKAADFLEEVFRNPTPELARNSICPSHYMGLIELYRTTREPRYLELARRLIAMRNLMKDGGDDNQDRVPFAEQTEALGHAVRANYLFAGVADLFAETGDRNLWTPLERIWTNIVSKKMYLTGGCGALYDGASPDGSRDQSRITRIHQAYGRNYQLPNTTAHNETCANIGNVLWNWRMFLVTGEARFMDVVELALYNSVLSGVGLDGTNFFYTNPLRVTDPMPTDLRWSRTRVPYVSSFCCPPNLVRTVAEASGYAYGKSAGAVWVNLYAASTLDTALDDGRRLKLTQATDYPWNGSVRITVNDCDAAPFALKLRIPSWAKSASLRINRASVKEAIKPGTYFEVRRAWKPGDVLELDLPMPVQLIEANPLVEETLGQVAVKRGPIVYCLESTDLPPGVHVAEVHLPQNGKFIARYDRQLLGGVTVMETKLVSRPAGNWSGQLYRELKPSEAKPVKAKLIPYFVWANRGKSEMSVWLPRQ